MTELQKVELNLLKTFVHVCDVLNLQYYAVCGTALGAVKYGGFIPWDDDVDVALLRPDYERFLKDAPVLLPDYIFLQNSKTDPEFPMLFSKLRDSRTTLIEAPVKHLCMNHGIYIDVFPLDGYPQKTTEIKRFEEKKAYFERRRKVSLNYNRMKFPKAVRTNSVYYLNRVFGIYRNTARTIEEYNEFLSEFDVFSSDYWCNHGNWQGLLEYAPKAQYGKGTFVQFEDLKIRIPELYDEYLTQKYGDWRSDLPEQKSHHDYIVCSTVTPYTAYSK